MSQYSQLLDRNNIKQFDEDFNPRLELMNIMESVLVDNRNTFKKQIELEYMELRGEDTSVLNEGIVSSIIDGIKAFFRKILEWLRKIKDWVLGFFNKSSSSNSTSNSDTLSSNNKDKDKSFSHIKYTNEPKNTKHFILIDKDMDKLKSCETEITYMNTIEIINRINDIMFRLIHFKDIEDDDSKTIMEHLIGYETLNEMEDDIINNIRVTKQVKELNKNEVLHIMDYTSNRIIQDKVLNALDNFTDSINDEKDMLIRFGKAQNNEKRKEKIIKISQTIINRFSKIINDSMKCMINSSKIIKAELKK